jgi:hypothetical protein
VVKITTAAAAVVGVILSIATAGNSASPNLVWWSVALSIATTIAAVALNVLPFGNWEKEHRDLFRQWTDIREDLDALLFDCPADGSPDVRTICDLKKLDAKIHRVCGQEPEGNRRFIAECYQSEVQSRRENSLVVTPTWFEHLAPNWLKRLVIRRATSAS